MTPLARWREGNAWATNVVLVALGAALLGLTRQFLVEHQHFAIGFSGVSGWSAFVYVVAAVVVLTQPVNRWTFWIVVGFAMAFQAVVYFSRPFTSSDIYRYVWDGIVQHAGVNPYRYVPGDPALTYLRAPNRDVFDHINRRDYARTIYPPVAQMVYYLATIFAPTVAAMKLAMISFACGTGAVLVALLRRMGRCREEVLLFAWCPVVVWEVGLAGHVDAVVLLFVALALLFRFRNQPLWTGLFLGLAIFTKFYPAVLFPALYTRRDWKMPAAVVAVGAVGYSVYSSAGPLMLGFLSGYREEEGMDTGERYFLLQLAQKLSWLESLPVWVYMVFCALVFGALTWWAWRSATVEVAQRGTTPVYLRVAMGFAFALMLLFSPHYPWYVLWLVPFFTLLPNLPVMTYVLAMFYLLTTALADGSTEKTLLLNERLYGWVAVACVLWWVERRWRAGRFFVTPNRECR